MKLILKKKKTKVYKVYCNQRTSVVERNDLTSMFFPVGATLASIKLFQFAVAQVKAGDKEFKTYKCGIFELSEKIGVDYHYLSNRSGFLKLVHSLDNLVGESTNSNGKNVTTIVYLYSMLRSDGKYIEFRLNNDLREYLLDLEQSTENYMKMLLVGSRRMSSAFSARLYNYIMRYCFFDGRVCNKNINLDTLKKVFGVTDRKSYTAYNKFDKWVLSVAVDEINLNGEAYIEYEPIRGKRGKVESIKFTIRRVSIKSTVKN